MAFGLPEGFSWIGQEEEENTGYESGVASTFGYNDPEDNGIGAWGDVTNDENAFGVALPISTLREIFGDDDKAHGAVVEVTNPRTGQKIKAPIVDKGPANWVLDRQGPTIDVTEGARRMLGMEGGLEPMEWKVLGHGVEPDSPALASTGLPEGFQWRSNTSTPAPGEAPLPEGFSWVKPEAAAPAEDTIPLEPVAARPGGVSPDELGISFDIDTNPKAHVVDSSAQPLTPQNVRGQKNREELLHAIEQTEKAGYAVPHTIGTDTEPEGDRAPTIDQENLVAALRKQEADQRKAGNKFIADGIARDISYWENKIKTEGMSAEQAAAAEAPLPEGFSWKTQMATAAPEGQVGMIEPGNIDLDRRPVVTSPEGVISTERSISITEPENKRTILIPTVVGGKVVDEDAAIAHYKKTGEHLGIFKDTLSADEYAQKLHLRQEQFYKGTGQSPLPTMSTLEADKLGLQKWRDLQSGMEVRRATLPGGIRWKTDQDSYGRSAAAPKVAPPQPLPLDYRPEWQEGARQAEAVYPEWQQAPTLKDVGRPDVVDAANMFLRGSSSEGLLATLEGGYAAVAANAPEGTVRENAIKQRDQVAAMRKRVRDQHLPVDRAMEESMVGQIMQGGGQMVSNIPAYAIGPYLGTAVGGTMAMLQLYDEARQDYIQTQKNRGKPVDEAAANKAAMQYVAAAGPVEILADKFIMGKFLKAAAAEGKTIGSVIREGAKTAGMEGTTEAGQQAWLNFVANTLSKYDPGRPMTKELASSFIVGGAVGGGAGALGAATAKPEGFPIPPEMAAKLESLRKTLGEMKEEAGAPVTEAEAPAPAAPAPVARQGELPEGYTYQPTGDDELDRMIDEYLAEPEAAPVQLGQSGPEGAAVLGGAASAQKAFGKTSKQSRIRDIAPQLALFKQAADRVGIPLKIDTGLSGSASINFRDPDNIYLGVNPDRVWMRDKSSNMPAGAEARITIGEEVIHAADILGLKKEWEASPQKRNGIDFGTYVHAQSSVVLDDIQNTIAAAPLREQDALYQAVADAYNVYTRNMAAPESRIAKGDPSVFDQITVEKNVMTFVKEFVRMAKQQESQGLISENTVKKMWEVISDWVNKALARIGVVLPGAREGKFGGLVQDELKRIDDMLASFGGEEKVIPRVTQEEQVIAKTGVTPAKPAPSQLDMFAAMKEKFKSLVKPSPAQAPETPRERAERLGIEPDVAFNPAVQVAGETFTGESHAKALINASKKYGKPMAAQGKTGFVDMEGNFVISTLGTRPGPATVNIGMATDDGKGITEAEILRALRDAGVKVTGYRVAQSETEPTVVAYLDKTLDPEEAFRLSEDLHQQAIAEKFPGGAELYGPAAEAWRPFNAAFFLEARGFTPSELARSVDEIEALARDYAQFRKWYVKFDQFLDHILGDNAAYKPLIMDFMAATSVQNNIGKNVRETVEKLRQFMETGDVTFHGLGHFPKAKLPNLRKAMEGIALGGPKVGPFSEALHLNPNAAAIDRHVAMILFNTRAPTPAQIKTGQQVCDQIAQRLGWTTAEAQAALWAAGKAIYGERGKIVETYEQFLEQQVDELNAILTKDREGGGRGLQAARRISQRIGPRAGPAPGAREVAVLGARGTDTKEGLTKTFIGRSDRFWGITENEDLGGAAFPDGTSAVVCTGYSNAIRDRLGANRVTIYGFWKKDNPGSSIARQAGGHDFALVDGRFIVDPWITDVESMSASGVFDLQDPKDGPEITRLYGDRSKWEQGLETEGAATEAQLGARGAEELPPETDVADAQMGRAYWMDPSGTLYGMGIEPLTHTTFARKYLGMSGGEAIIAGWARVRGYQGRIYYASGQLSNAQQRALGDMGVYLKAELRKDTEGVRQMMAQVEEGEVLGARGGPPTAATEKPRINRVIQVPLIRTQDLSGGKKRWHWAKGPPVDLARFWRSTKDVFANTPGYEFMAKAIAKHVDLRAKYRGKYTSVLTKAWDTVPRTRRKEALQDFETYWKTNQEQGKAAADALTISPHARSLIDATMSILDEMGTINQQRNVHVFDPAIGAWRLIGKIGSDGDVNYFPRMIKAHILDILHNPAHNPAAWEQLKDQLIAEGKIDPATADADMLAYVDNVVQTYKMNGFFGSLDMARSPYLPNLAYDYSFDVVRRYVESWSERMAQIEAFGQKLGKQGKDLFDRAQEMAGDMATRRYIKRVQDLAYNAHIETAYGRAIAVMNNIGTATQLAQYAATMKNFLSGMGFNWQNLGTGRFLYSFLNLGATWREIRDGYERGVLQDDLMNIMRDGEIATGEVSKTGRLAGFGLKVSGFKAAETWVRGVSMVGARAMLRSARKAYNKNRRSAKSRRWLGYFQRLGIDGEALILEGGQGDLFDAYMRRSVNEIQGGYTYADVPAFMDEPTGRFLLKYQKWGVEQLNHFNKGALQPALRKVGLAHETVEITNAQGQKEKVRVPGELLPLARYLWVLAMVGAGAEWGLENLFGRFSKTASIAQIMATWRRDKMEAFTLAMQKVHGYLLMAGAGGILGNYTQIGLDFTERTRFKNPFEPPGLAPFKETINALIDLFDQKSIHPKDLDDFLEKTVGFYRTTKQMAARAQDVFGVTDFRELEATARRQDYSWIRSVTRRYDKSIGAKENVRFSGRTGKSETSYFRDMFFEDLVLGDQRGAARRLDAHLKGMSDERREVELRNLRQSVAGRQPIKVGSGGGDREAMRANFLAWAKRNLGPDEVARINRIDQTYRRTAQALDLMREDEIVPELNLNKAMERIKMLAE